MMHIVIEHIAQTSQSVCACVPHTQAMDVPTTVATPGRTEEMQDLEFKCCVV